MSLDTLLTVGFVVFFIVLPLVSRALQARNRPQAGRPPGPQAGRPSLPGRPAGPPTDQDLPAWVVEAQRRVREARAAASGEPASMVGENVPWVPPADATTLAPPPPEGGLVPQEPAPPLAPPARTGGLVPQEPAPPLAPSARTGGLVPEDPFGGGLVGPSDATRGGAGLGRAGPPTTTAAGRRAAPRRALMVVEDVEGAVAMAGARPRATAVGARLGAVKRLHFERGAIVRGLIWHEILDEPAWVRRRGRRPSRRRSR